MKQQFGKKEDDDDFECDSKSFTKLKYNDKETAKLSYLDDYENGVIEGYIFLELELAMDPFKTVSVRQSTGFLDYIGNVGGFYTAVDLMIYMIAEFFSAKFFLASVACSMFIKTKP